MTPFIWIALYVLVAFTLSSLGLNLEGRKSCHSFPTLPLRHPEQVTEVHETSVSWLGKWEHELGLVVR